VTCVLGVDPGTRKVGYAVVGSDGSIFARGIDEMNAFSGRIPVLMAAHGISTIALGGGTNVGPVRLALAGIDVPVELVDERETTIEARALYFAHNPPRGWRRLIPRGLLLPPDPIDDFAAVLIARRWLASRAAQGGITS
jgi:RNase H-fold protein (predicted Holliday junction resolvase)